MSIAVRFTGNFH